LHSLIVFLRKRLLLRAASSLIILLAGRADGSAGPALSGSVSDKGGGPLAGATVSVHKLSGDRYDQSAQTNGQGQYSFPELPNGEYSVGAELQGFVSVSFNPVRIYFPYHVHWDFVLHVAYLGGEGGIYASSDLLGELMLGRARVANASICLTRSDGSGNPACTTTNRLGQYFLSVSPGVYDVTVVGPGGVKGKQRLDASGAGEYRDRIVLDKRP
jgi:hypothetical protein